MAKRQATGGPRSTAKASTVTPSTSLEAAGPAVPVAQAGRDPFAAPDDADLHYIHPDLRRFAVRIDSLVPDPQNVKDHGEDDLPTHAKSLRDFGIRRIVICRTANRQITAGNGTTAAAKQNGWDYVPALFFDDDANKARAFALADNAIATLAPWDEERVAELTREALEWAGELDIGGLVNSVLASCGLDNEADAEEQSETPAEPPAAGSVPVGNVLITRRVIVTCVSEKQQLELIAELQGRGLECEVSSKLAR